MRPEPHKTTPGNWRRASTLLLCGWSLVLFGQPVPASSPSGPSLAVLDAFENWRSTGAKDPARLQTGLALAAARAKEMRALMEHDPEKFAGRAMSEADRNRLPAQIRDLVEHPVSGKGFYGVYCVYGKPDQPQGGPLRSGQHRTEIVREAVVNGQRYRAHVSGAWADLQTTQETTISGIALGDAIALTGTTSAVGVTAGGAAVPALAPSTTGANTLLYMVARFSDETSEPITDVLALSQMEAVSNFWKNCSGGIVGVQGLVQPLQPADVIHIVLPQPKSYGATYNGNFALLLSDARAAALAQGYNYANYNLDVVVTSDQLFNYAGLSYIGAQGSHWVIPYTSLRTAGHELGHNLGLYHANYWRSDSPEPFGKDSNPGGYAADYINGEWMEYGHYFSIMSAQYGAEWDDPAKPIYNPAEKAKLGWLPGSAIAYVTHSGTYRLFRHDARATVGTPRGIRIEIGSTDYTGYVRRYWLGYRYAPWNTAKDWFRNGVELDVAKPAYGADGSILLDMTPFSNDQSSPFYNATNRPANWWMIDNSDKLDGALAVGRTYSDSGAGIHITPLATGSNGTDEEYIDVAINLGTFSTNHSPVLLSFSSSATQVAPGQPVSFSATATDPDGDALAWSWDFADATWTASGLNSATAWKSWSTPGQYRVMARASDMKGGLGAASMVVTVGTPAETNQIWGRVIWGGVPVYGARVWTSTAAGVRQVWTDGEGQYALPGLPAAAGYSVNCAKAGLTFTPQFSGPVSLMQGNFYGADFYANEARPAPAVTTYTISGQVTSPSAASGVEVRCGGMVTTTDASGSYQFTHVTPGTYTIAPAKPSWVFSPASLSVTVQSANSSLNNFARVAPHSLSGTVSGVPASAPIPPFVYLSNGGSAPASLIDPAAGTWSFSIANVPSGQYSLIAACSGYALWPSNFTVPLSISADLSNLEFSACASNTPGLFRGRIMEHGRALSAARVDLIQSGNTVASVTTDDDGCYFIANVPAPAAYSLVPNKPGYSFAPAALTVSTATAVNQDFAASGPIPAPAVQGITVNPPSGATLAGTTTLSVNATGSSSLTYHWDALVAQGPVTYSANDSITASFTVVSFVAAGDYTFRVRVVDASGLTTTSNLTFTVHTGPARLAVAPYHVETTVGQTISFRSDAWDQLGQPVLLPVSWSASGGGSIDSSGNFLATTPGGPYSVVATGSGLSATGSVWISPSGALVPPLITAQPQNQLVNQGGNATFSISVSSGTPFTNQWFFNATPVPGATNTTLTVPNVQDANAGWYSVVVDNGVAVVSSNALLTINHLPIPVAPVLERVASGGVKKRVAEFLGTDPDADPLALSSAGPASAQGGTIAVDAGWVLYNPPAGWTGADSFGFSVSDGRGGISPGTAAVNVIQSLAQSQNLRAQPQPDGSTRLVFDGIPGRTYSVEYADNLATPVWHRLALATADDTGSFVFVDLTTGVTRFYRAAEP